MTMQPLPTQYGADLDARTPKNWTPLSYAKAKGKYGVTHEKGIYPEDVLKVRSSAPRFRCAPRLRRRAVLRRSFLRHRSTVPRQPQARMHCTGLQPVHCMSMVHCMHGALSCACGAAARGRATTRRRRTSCVSAAATKTSRSTRRALSVRPRMTQQMSELMTYTHPQTTNPFCSSCALLCEILPGALARKPPCVVHLEARPIQC